MISNKEKSIWKEIKVDYIDSGDAYLLADSYNTAEGATEQDVIAIVYPDGTVDHKDKRAETDSYALEMIENVIKNVLTNLPIETLDELIGYLRDVYNNLISGGMEDNEGQYHNIAKYLKFLENLRELYWECPGCGRLIAPDEKYIVSDEQSYCMKCAREGVI